MSEALKLTTIEHEKLAAQLYKAARTGNGIIPPSESLSFTMQDAYRIRRKLVDLMLADGGTAKGHKIGFTSKAMQEMYGMTEPDFGQLLDFMFVSPTEPVNVSNLSDTRVEPELAFKLSQPLTGPGITVEDVLDATDYVTACVELIDSRVGAMRARAVDSISDNAGAGLVILGDVEIAPRDLDLVNIPIEMTVDGETLRGISGAVMGHPAEPVAWLANKLASIDGLGGSIEAGDIIISRSSTRSLAVKAGSGLSANFGAFGDINIAFT